MTQTSMMRVLDWPASLTFAACPRCATPHEWVRLCLYGELDALCARCLAEATGREPRPDRPTPPVAQLPLPDTGCPPSGGERRRKKRTIGRCPWCEDRRLLVPDPKHPGVSACRQCVAL